MVPVQQDAVEAAVMEADAILVMLVESVHRISFSVFAQRRINPDAPTSILMQDYHQLDIWNPRAMDYAVAVYKFAASLPEQEKYNLASPLRRARNIGTIEYRRGLRHGDKYGSSAAS